MNATIEAQLNEVKRDALVGYYLAQVIPKKGEALAKQVRTAEDLYAYLLIDPLVSSTVRTSKVAEGISSLQLYLNRLVQGREPQVNPPEDDDVRQWQENDSRYAIWAGNRALEAYPENYLNPTLRKSKTTLFKQLENRLNQGRINKDEAQRAVLDYLNGFEEISNLDVVSGYESWDGSHMIYLIGRTKNKPYKYYWRSLNMAKSFGVGGKNVSFFPTDWTEWKTIDVAVGNAMDGLVRPIFMNGRFYIAWCELTEQEGQGVDAKPEMTLITKEGANSQLALSKPIKQSGTFVKLAFKRFDDTWSVPLELKHIPGLKKVVKFGAHVDFNAEKEELHLWVHSNQYIYKYDALLNYIPDTGQTPDFDAVNSEQLGTKIVMHGHNSSAQWKIIPQVPQDIEKSDSLVGRIQQLQQKVEVARILLDAMRCKPWPEVLMKCYELFATLEIKSEDFIKNPLLLTLEGLSNELQLKLKGWEADLRFLSQFDSCVKSKELVEYTVTGDEKFEVKTPILLEGLNHKIVLSLSGSEIELSGPELENNTSKKWQVKLPKPTANSVTLKVNLKVNLEWKSSTTSNTEYIRLLSLPLILIPPKEKAKGGSYEYIKICSTVVKSEVTTEGFAQYLEFPKGRSHAHIRLNTLFAKTLIKNAYIGIDAVLGLPTQNITEPALDNGSTKSVPMDFHGANGLYFWELFFHMPLLVAHRLNLEQRFDDARQWLHYLFLPSNTGNCWRTQVLLEDEQRAGEQMIGPGAVDPDELAMVAPIHYRKAVFFAYIKNLLDQGDACYRELTREALGEAKQWYLQARALLGEVPTTEVSRNWKPEVLGALAITDKPSEAFVQTNAFSLPLNKALHDYWEQIDSRLYNLRHNLTVDGKPWTPPLFDAPLNPMELLAARGRAGSGSSRAVMAMPIPPLRFTAMMGKAMNAVEMLIQFGNALQNTLERKDAAELERLQQMQQKELLGFTLEMQDLTIEMGKKTLAGLELSHQSAQTRQAYYQRLFNEHTSAAEDQVRILRGTASGMAAGAPALRTAAAIASMVPNIYGMATGGAEYGAPLYAVADGLLCESEIFSLQANQLEISEQYRRRAEEWKLQSELATVEAEQINTQIMAEKQQLALFEKQKAQIKAQQVHLQANQAFLTSRFTAESLYQWMAGQLSALYFQAYDAVVSLCLLSEAAWRYETGDYDTPSFIQPGAWQDLYRGLLAGETLKLGLHRMDHAYLTRNERKLEIVHTVSLKQLFDSRKSLSSQKEQSWVEKVEELKGNGKLEFDLTERDFDQRYPGHYLRQIVTVSVSFPAVIGPYQDVRAILTQRKSKVNLKPQIDGVRYLLNPLSESEVPSVIKTDLRASQQIALSTGIDDSGLFMLNFGDERYLPFEGTGAVSSWTLTFPQYGDQETLLDSLTDIIVCIRYTARDGGEKFGKDVVDAMKEQNQNTSSSQKKGALVTDNNGKQSETENSFMEVDMNKEEEKDPTCDTATPLSNVVNPFR